MAGRSTISLVLADDGEPFPDRDSARREIDALEARTGALYEVVDYRDGFAVAPQNAGDPMQPSRPCNEPTAARAGDLGPAKERAKRGPSPPSPDSEGEGLENRVLRPSPRAYWHWVTLACVSVVVAVQPHLPLKYLQQEWGHLQAELPSLPTMSVTTENAALVMSTTALTGLALATWSVAVVIIAWLYARYVIGEDFVRATRGIVARDVDEVRIRDIRAVNLRQSLMERLLGVGTLHIATAGNEGDVLTMANISGPMRAKLQIEQRRRALAAQGALTDE